MRAWRPPGGVPAILLATAVALAFADSSIVMLGLPQIYGELNASIPGVSLVITAYNLVVAAVALALVPVVRRTRPVIPLVAGLAIFTGASLGCGLAQSLPVLVALRAVQGLGGALLLAGSLPVMAALTGSGRSGRSWWGVAGTVGAVIGPAVGGVLTEAFEWRAIFIAQAPVAAVGLMAALSPEVRALAPDRARAEGRPWAAVGLVFAFGALVGALFLAVLMIVTVWGMGPLLGAFVVSVLPVAAVAVRPLEVRAGEALSALAGAVLLVLGLMALALLPSTTAGWAVAALAVCGAGFGLLVPPLTARSVEGERGLAVAGTMSVAARHVGLVAALAVVAPVLALDLGHAGDRATLNATQVILDARLGLGHKIPVALSLADEFRRTPRGAVPDLAKAFDENGAQNDASVRRVRDDLVGAIEAALTRGFRRAYLVAALFAALALIPVGIAWRPRGLISRRGPPAATALLAVIAAGVVLLALELGRGGAHLGRSTQVDPCAIPERPAGGGLDAALQGVLLDGLAGAACELHVSREDLVLSLGPDVGGDGERRIPWDDATTERAIRAGMVRAIDDAEQRGTLNGILAQVLRALSQRAPLGEIIRGSGQALDLARQAGSLPVDPGAILDRLKGLIP
jgi:predicted MFS family arabinose efflux permease